MWHWSLTWKRHPPTKPTGKHVEGRRFFLSRFFCDGFSWCFTSFYWVKHFFLKGFFFGMCTNCFFLVVEMVEIHFCLNFRGKCSSHKSWTLCEFQIHEHLWSNSFRSRLRMKHIIVSRTLSTYGYITTCVMHVFMYVYIWVNLDEVQLPTFHTPPNFWNNVILGKLPLQKPFFWAHHNCDDSSSYW